MHPAERSDDLKQDSGHPTGQTGPPTENRKNTAPPARAAGPVVSSLTTQKLEKMKKYECTVCNWVYDPAIGDPESGVAPGTPFEELPDDWTCPECGVGKDMFEEVP